MARKMGGDIRIRYSEPGFTIINFDITYETKEDLEKEGVLL